MSCGFQLLTREKITFQAFVVNMDTGDVCYEITDQVQTLSKERLKVINEGGSGYVEGWEFKGDVDLSGQPAGGYGIRVDVTLNGKVEAVLPVNAFAYSPAAQENEQAGYEINEDGLYAAGLDDWSSKTFLVAKNYGLPVTGFLYLENGLKLESISVTLYNGDEKLKPYEAKATSNKLVWQKNRTSCADARAQLEDNYGVTVGNKYQGGFALLIPYNDLKNLTDGRHQLEVAIKVSNENGPMVISLMQTVTTVQDAEAHPEALGVKNINDFVRDYID